MASLARFGRRLRAVSVGLPRGAVTPHSGHSAAEAGHHGAPSHVVSKGMQQYMETQAYFLGEKVRPGSARCYQSL
jgi:hypothetical protein